MATLLVGGGLLDSSFSQYQKKQTAERAWLLYYNRYLYDRGVINSETRSKMATMIHARCGPTDKYRGLVI